MEYIFIRMFLDKHVSKNKDKSELQIRVHLAGETPVLENMSKQTMEIQSIKCSP